jgi:hypothetical protein
VKIESLLSLVLDSILGSELFESNSNSNNSRERVLDSRDVKELIDLDILTKWDYTLLYLIIILRKLFELFRL